MSEIKAHDFEVWGGQSVDDRGKTHWPDCLNVSMARWQALDLIQVLAHQLRDAEREIIQFSHMGKLDFDIDEDAAD